jgi:hypothetical protein
MFTFGKPPPRFCAPRARAAVTRMPQHHLCGHGKNCARSCHSMLMTSTRRKRPYGPARSPGGYCRRVSFSYRGGRDQALFHPSLSPTTWCARSILRRSRTSALFHPLESLSPPAPNLFSRCLVGTEVWVVTPCPRDLVAYAPLRRKCRHSSRRINIGK